MTTTTITTAAATTRKSTGTKKAPAATTKTTPAKGTMAAAKPAPAKPAVEAPKAPRTLAITEGTQKCEGACGKVLPMTKFPTKAAKPGQVPVRGKVCRADMAAARDAKKAAAAKK